MRLRLILAEILFWMHFLIGALWLGLFLIPSSFWQNKITFHFYLTVVIVAHQFLWGLVLTHWTKKFRMVCILTTPMQLLRNQKISDPKNYEHSFFKELVGKNGIKISHSVSTLLTLFALLLVTLQYFFLR